jgi:putative drug exporter of the RND superfamily
MRLVTGRRFKYAVLVVFILLAGALASQSGKLSDVTSSDLAQTLPEGAESLEVVRASENLGDDVSPAIVVYHRDGRLGDEDRRRINEDRRTLDEKPPPLVVRVGRPQTERDTAILTIALRETSDNDATGEAVDALRMRVGSTEGKGAGLQIAVTGGAAFSADISSVFEGVDTTLLAITGSIVLILLVLIYRSPIFWAVPFFVVVLTEAATRGAGYLIGQAGLTITGQGTGILIVLVFGAATDYALLLVARYREELEREQDTHAAMRTALRSAGPAILASGGTVVVALLTLLLARVGGTQAIGPLGAGGVALAMLFSLTALPAALLIVGRRAFWPSIPRAGPATDHAERGVFANLARRIPNHARVLWVGSAIVLVVLALGLAGIDPTLTQQQQFTEEVEAVTGQELLDDGFPAGTSAPASVVVPRGAPVDDARRALEHAPQVASVGEAREGPSGTLLTVVLEGDPYAPNTVGVIPGLRRLVAEAVPGTLIGGPTAQEYDLREAANRDTLVVPPAALTVVLVILVVLLRSLAAPVLLLITVVASNLAALGVGVLLSEHVYDFPAIDPTLPLLGFIFLAALGIDYNIFLAARAREETRQHGPRSGMLRALALTGAVITAAGVVLAATFATLGLLPLVVLAQLGTVVALGVLIDTLLVRSILVPALAHDLGHRFWWPSRIGRDAEALSRHSSKRIQTSVP